MTRSDYGGPDRRVGSNGVAMLYRWSVEAERQREFVSDWRAIARELRRSGASGCCLLGDDNGELLALVRWPSEYARSRCRKALAAIGREPTAMVEDQLTVLDDAAPAYPVALGIAL